MTKALRSQAQLLIDQGLTAPADSAAFKTAAALRAKAATGRALSDFELGALHAENAAALKAPYAAKLAEDIVRESLEQTGNAAQSAGEKSALRPIEQYLPDGPKRSITEVDRAVKIALGDADVQGFQGYAEGAGDFTNKNIAGTNYNKTKPTQDWIDMDEVNRYAQRLKAGEKLPPILVYEAGISLTDIIDLLQVK